MLTRHQAIIWTNNGKFTDGYMHHSASMSEMGILMNFSSINLTPDHQWYVKFTLWPMCYFLPCGKDFKTIHRPIYLLWILDICRADSSHAPSQWKMSLQCNAISHWLGANLKSALYLACQVSHSMWTEWAVTNCKSPLRQTSAAPASVWKTL